ncbi:MAG: peptide chain release factor N(5)-glutamine methyltransferase [Gammaproteobacteria bacterium]|nr:peptide chain release factor N(5)-glutamine methyltransferase [Gammaproteobacteria bacterium]MCP5136266.1 peptide chain release factor N(5)-glutamine methyltransferase [Gammaproteobacteria bacterium]
MNTIIELLNHGTGRLSGLDTPRLDAELLLAHCLNVNQGHFLTWPEQAVSATDRDRFLDLITRRAEGVPVAYLLGHWGFWSLDLRVTPDVLVPRPETELLVEHALAALPASSPMQIADLGTGSGAIALAIARERPNWRVIATDRSEAALAIARDNARLNQIENVEFRLGSWCETLQEADLDMIVSNPPYITDDDPHLANLRFEPGAALASGADGLADIRALVTCAQRHLFMGGVLLLEHGYHQQGDVRFLMEAQGFTDVLGFRDLAGQPRAVLGRRGGLR